VGPFLERPTTVGRPAKHTRRNIWDAVQYLAASGCQWRMPPKDFPPYSTVRHYFYRWRERGSIVAIDEALSAASRLAAGRAEAASAGIIDSQSVKTTESGGPRGHDAGKKAKGRERHIVTDTLGNILDAVVHTADIQDRDGAPGLIECVRDNFPALARIFADGGYAGEKLAAAIAHLGGLALEIVKRSDTRGGFRGVTQTLDRRANVRLVGPLPLARQRLGGFNRLVRGMAVSRVHPARGQSDRASLKRVEAITSQTLR